LKDYYSSNIKKYVKVLPMKLKCLDLSRNHLTSNEVILAELFHVIFSGSWHNLEELNLRECGLG
jgi:Ran GTPase-activating protein (RanGAP) involved in mRNA processing and transport